MAPSVPSPEQVTTYLAAHSLETAIEEAVNDAVLKQVKEPFRHIAQILLKKSEEVGEASAQKAGVRRVSLDATVDAADKSADSLQAVSGEEQLQREYRTTETVELQPELLGKLRTFFDKMDTDSNGEVDYDEAIAFWGKNFAKVNAKSMFNEVDADGNKSITWDEFLKFWQNVVGSGYPEADVLEEVNEMLGGGSWVDFNDGRTT